MIRGHPTVDTEERMGDGVGDFLAPKKCCQLKEVGAKPVDFAELSLVRIPRKQVHLASVLRKIAGDLHAREKPLPAPQFPQGAEGIMIRQGDKIVPLAAQLVVELFRPGKAVRDPGLAKDPLRRAAGMPGMKMKVTPGHVRRMRLTDIPAPTTL
jgi:hypothetical protein